MWGALAHRRRRAGQCRPPRADSAAACAGALCACVWLVATACGANAGPPDVPPEVVTAPVERMEQYCQPCRLSSAPGTTAEVAAPDARAECVGDIVLPTDVRDAGGRGDVPARDTASDSERPSDAAGPVERDARSADAAAAAAGFALQTLADCGAGLVCRAVRPEATTGVCVAECAPGRRECPGELGLVCVDPASGATLLPEPAGQATGLCLAPDGGCPAACLPNRGDCDRRRDNGCETDLTADPAHCGRCGIDCAARFARAGFHFREAVCELGRCVPALDAVGKPRCAEGYADCNESPGDGCEAKIGSDLHCEGCYGSCASEAPPNMTAHCRDFACSRGGVTYRCVPDRCLEGFMDCNRDSPLQHPIEPVADGCETDVMTGLYTCGSCDNECCRRPAPTGPRDAAEAADAASQADDDASTPPYEPPCTRICVNGRCEATAPQCPLGSLYCVLPEGTGCFPMGLDTRCTHCADDCTTRFTNATGRCDTSSGLLSSYHCVMEDCEPQTEAPVEDWADCCDDVTDDGVVDFGNCDLRSDNGCEVDLRSSLDHCGECYATCDAAAERHVVAECVAGVCRTETCMDGYANCEGPKTCPDDDPSCEVDCEVEPAVGWLSAPADPVQHCGDCGVTCETTNAEYSQCLLGECDPHCMPDYEVCDHELAAGCVVFLLEGERDSAEGPIRHCGECNRTCGTDGASETRCVNGTCEWTCLPGREDCDGDSENGCEADTTTDVANCGGCGTACPSAHGTPSCECSTPSCENSTCSIECDLHWEPCDDDPTNGCDTNTQTNPAHCGVCNHACPAETPVCSGGRCGECPNGTGNCETELPDCETETNFNDDHCGECHRVCEDTNGTNVCKFGECEPDCDPGFGDCDGERPEDRANGCETDLSSSDAHCGRCGLPCSSEHGANPCVDSFCQPSCTGDWRNCDGDGREARANGCETWTFNNDLHCGECHRACENDHGTNSCEGRDCAPGCDPGWGNCDHNNANGCETRTINNDLHCGVDCEPCEQVGGTNRCNRNGRCEPSCFHEPGVVHFEDCDGDGWNGCEVNLLDDDKNCGECYRECYWWQDCQGGQCVLDGSYRLFHARPNPRPAGRDRKDGMP